MINTLNSHVQQRPTLDPVVTLQVPIDLSVPSKEKTPGSRFSVSSVCFLPLSDSAHDSQTDSSDDEEMSFRCRDLVKQEKRHDRDTTAGARDAATSLSLSGTKLVSCHLNGDSFVWDLGRRRIVSEFCKRRGQGMALRRMGGSSRNILYQTRDPQGIVSIHDTETSEVVTNFQTHSFSFCTAAPCSGNNSVLVLPTAHECFAEVRDIRVSPESLPVIRFHGAGLTLNADERKHGMLTSVAMSEPTADNGCPVAACGMESGTAFFHDLRMPRYPTYEGKVIEGSRLISCNVKLGKDPVLGIDLASSSTRSGNGRSFVSIAGMAGDATDLSELPVEERGTVGVIKASFHNNESSLTATARLRARVSTCKVSGPGEPIRGGKPGVNLCRFRPDGRVFGVGGWDRRVRIFDRSGKVIPLAILKGHGDSITALDWAPDSQTTGFLATGAGDGRICIWRCFPSGI